MIYPFQRSGLPLYGYVDKHNGAKEEDGGHVTRFDPVVMKEQWYGMSFDLREAPLFFLSLYCGLSSLTS